MIIDASNYLHLIPKQNLKDLDFITSKITETGHSAYIIGGAVRDLLLQKIPNEYDLTTSLKPEEIKLIFKRVIETGIQHGTVTIMIGEEAYEITTFRKDIDYTDGRRPDKIEFGNSLEEDMKRRDFTMNAIALDLNKKIFIDENSGIQDIQDKIIRTIGKAEARFGEDGLRPIRAIRFHSKLNFSIESETYRAIFKTRDVTKKISKERFHDELNKILLSSNPKSGITELLTNSIFALFTTKDLVLSNTSVEIGNLNELSSKLLGVRLAYLLILLIGKDKTDLEIYDFLFELKYSNANIQDACFFFKIFQVENLIFHDKIIHRKFLSSLINFTKARANPIYLECIQSILTLQFNTEDVIKFIFESETILQDKNIPLILKDLALDGNQLMIEFPKLEKKLYGACLKDMLEFVFKFPEKNNRIDLIEFLKLK